MMRKIGVPVAGVVVVIVAVLGGIFLFAGDEREPDSGQAAGPAPTTRLSAPDVDPSGTEPVPDDPYPPVPSAQVDGPLTGHVRTAGRNLYIPVSDSAECPREQVWPHGEHADRVEVDIRATPPPGMTTDAQGNGGYFSYGCGAGPDGPYAVIELAEPLGDRRLVVTYGFEAA